MNQSTRVRVVIVEDHPLFSEALAALLTREDFEVVGQAADRASALTLAGHYHPGLIVLDVGLPDVCGVDLINPLHRTCPDAKIVVLTGFSEPQYFKDALRLGAHAFLSKEMPPRALVRALRGVLQGERIVGQPQALSTILVEYGQVLREREQGRFGLTDQEITILQLAASGLNNKDIGAHQFWSEITIKRKMQDIYRKMEVKSRAQAVAEAIRVGII